MVQDAARAQVEYLAQRKSEMDRAIDSNVPPGMDEKELAERSGAAKAYAGENEKHYVEYAQDCIDSSRKANEEIRATWAAAYDTFKEREPANYGNKEEWQSKIVLPRPFQTVMYGASAIKKAFNPNFLKIENKKNPPAAEFWQRVAEVVFDSAHGNFPVQFTDATVMALAVGQSQEMIPRWIPGKGLEITLVEPWKIHRDLDTAPRDPQSGMFWIHQEWLDFWQLKQGEKAGRYMNVDRARDVTSEIPNDEFMTREAIADRKDQIWNVGDSKFRTLVLTSEFYGIVLSPKGEMLLPSATYTISGGRMISEPKPVSYGFHRWPGVCFSPLPDILRHGGRGLLQGVISVWNAMNTVMCLHMDNLIWVVNPMTEVNTDRLVDPADAATWPGKEFQTREGAHGEPSVRSIERNSRTNEIIANIQFLDQSYYRGSFVPENVQGLPGWRQDMTFREAAMNLNQSMSVYALLGENLELGAKQASLACLDVVRTFATWDDYSRIFTQQELETFKATLGFDKSSNELGVQGVPQIAGELSISGIEALLKENEAMEVIRNVLVPLSEHPRFGRYIKAYPILSAIEKRTAIKDENMIATPVEAEKIDKMQDEALKAAQERQSKGVDLQEALGIAELMKKLSEVEKIGKENMQMMQETKNMIDAGRGGLLGSPQENNKKPLQNDE
jgi:urease gamma subunit